MTVLAPARALAALVVVLALSGCSAVTDETKVVTFAVAGDSLTAWDNETFPEPTGALDPVTWTSWAISPTMQLAGGYARGMATSADVAASILRVDADVLVVMIGTNDAGIRRPLSVLTDIDSIVDKAGARAVLVSAIPPHQWEPTLAAQFNDSLRAHAEERGWGFVDPWESARAGNDWVDGTTFDGLHPTADAAKKAGEAISRAIRELVG